MNAYPNIGNLPQEGFVRLPQVLQVMGVGRTSWWNGVKAGRFPKPVKLGARTSAWRVEDIRALIASFAHEADGEPVSVGDKV